MPEQNIPDQIVRIQEMGPDKKPSEPNKSPDELSREARRDQGEKEWTQSTTTGLNE